MKLTAITVIFKGKSKTEFHMCEMINGKAIANESIINHMLDSMGCQNGQTYSLG